MPILTTLGVIILFITLYSCLFSDKITKIILLQLGKNTDMNIEVQKTKFSILKNFPYASLSFYDIKIKSLGKFKLSSTDSVNSQYFLIAKEISLKFNLILLMKGQYLIDGINLKQARINCLINKDVMGNFNLSDLKVPSKSRVKFKIKNIFLKNVQLIYLSEKNKFYSSFFIKQLKLNGLIQQTNYYFNIETEIKNLIISSDKLFYNFPKHIYIQFFIEKVFDYIRCSKGKIKILDNILNFSGISSLEFPFKYSSSFTINNFKINQIIKYLNFTELNKISSNNGTININGFLKGTLKKNEFPELTANVYLNNLSYLYMNRLNFNKISGEIKFYGKNKINYNYFIVTKNLHGYFQDSKFQITGYYLKTYQSYLSVYGNTQLKLNNLNKIINNNKFYLKNGEANFTYYLRGSFDSKNVLDLNKISLNADGDLNNMDCTLYNNLLYLKNVSGQISGINKVLSFKSLKGLVNDNFICFNGTVQNTFSIYHDSTARYIIGGSIKSSKIKLDELYSDLNKILSDSLASDLKFNCSLTLGIDTLVYKKIFVKNLSSDMIYQNEILSFNNIYFQTCDGSISNGNIKSKSENKYISISTGCTIKNIDLEKFLISFENFDQAVFTSDNIKGNISGKTTLIFCLDKNMKIIKENLKGQANITIDRGELKNFQPIFKLSKFMNLSDLNDIKFEKISNQIIIREDTINIPPMDINSSAISLTLSGIHTLGNEYEYHFKVSLSDILFKNLKIDDNKEIEYTVEKDTLRRMNVFVRLKGKGNDYKTTYDKKQSYKSFSEKIKKEGIGLKSIFKEEFGLFNKDSTIIKTSKNVSKKNFKIESDEIKNVKTNKAKQKVNTNKTNVIWKDE